MPEFFTSVFDFTDDAGVVRAPDWTAVFKEDRQRRFSSENYQNGQRVQLTHAKQLWISADDLASAERARDLIFHCFGLQQGYLPQFIDRSLPDQTAELPANSTDPAYIRSEATNIWKAVKIAPRIHAGGHNYYFALFRYALSVYLAPHLNSASYALLIRNLQAAPPIDPILRIRLATSIHQSVAGIEQLLGNVDLARESESRSALESIRVDPNQLTAWETLQDEAPLPNEWRSPRDFQEIAALAHGNIRSGRVPLVSALRALLVTRHTVAHAISERHDRAIYYFLAANAQRVLRQTLLDAAGCWRGWALGLSFFPGMDARFGD